MPRALAALLVLLVSLAGAPAAAGEVIEVDSAGLQRLIVAGLPVVDIRRPDEWRQTGVVPESHLITFLDASGRIDPAFFESMTSAVKATQPVALICRTGNRSQLAARLLAARLGYGRVYSVAGGIESWISDRRPVRACENC
jgi:rhodanese-related sulfurtransferase